MPRLENWMLMSRIDSHGNPYQQLIGEVYEYPGANSKTGEYINGNNIMTSKLIDLDVERYKAITQSGTVYELGFRSVIDGI